MADLAALRERIRTSDWHSSTVLALIDEAIEAAGVTAPPSEDAAPPHLLVTFTPSSDAAPRLVDCGIASCPFRGVEHIGHGMSVARRLADLRAPGTDAYLADDEDSGLWAGVALMLTVAVVAFVAGYLVRWVTS